MCLFIYFFYIYKLFFIYLLTSINHLLIVVLIYYPYLKSIIKQYYASTEIHQI